MNLINNSALYTRRLLKIRNSRQLLYANSACLFKERLELLLGLRNVQVIKRKIGDLFESLYFDPKNGWVYLEISEWGFQVDV